MKFFSIASWAESGESHRSCLSLYSFLTSSEQQKYAGGKRNNFSRGKQREKSTMGNRTTDARNRFVQDIGWLSVRNLYKWTLSSIVKC